MIATLSVEGLALERGERRLVEGLSFEVRAGEAVALTGANGAGKTTLLRALAGLVRPAAGTVAFEAADGSALEADAARAAAVHLLGHQDGFEPGRRARDELTFQAAWLGGADARVELAVEALGLAPLMDLEVRRLSAGQRRRLALARLIAAPRDLWLLDEPLAPLDERWRAGVGQLMGAHLSGGGLILAAVHDPLPFPARELRLEAAA